MFDLEAVARLLKEYGLAIIAPIAVVEGPIVSVIAGHLASLGYFDPVVLTIVLVLADLVGDLGFYALGRSSGGGLSERLRRRMGFSPEKLEDLKAQYRRRGGRLLIFGKLTHGAGALFLFAAGAAHMRFAPFMFYNTLATIPKSLFFVLIGMFSGQAYAQIDKMISTAGLAVLVLLGLCGGVWLWISRRKSR